MKPAYENNMARENEKKKQWRVENIVLANDNQCNQWRESSYNGEEEKQ